MRTTTLCALWLGIAGCASPRQAPSATVEAEERAAITALLAAEPADWIPCAEAVLTRGRPAASALARALQDAPGAPGVQPALAVLGALGDPAGGEVLRAFLRADGPHASEAALALGRLGASAAVPDLEATLADHARTPLVRTAAAAALLDLGRSEAASAFYYALFTVDTSAAGREVQEQGLTSKPRWALERTIAIGALRRCARPDAFGLDADAPWPRLAEAAARMRAHFGPERGGK